MTAINVFQRNWAFTDKDSDKPIIRTGRFGPCCVVTFASERFVAMTHIDTCTDVDSMAVIFKKFSDNSVEFKDVKVIILGGWKCDLSFIWATKVVKKISDAGFTNVSTKKMFSKLSNEIKADESAHFHFGANIDARNGNTYIINKKNDELDKEQCRQYLFLFDNWKLLEQCQEVSLPITQVV